MSRSFSRSPESQTSPRTHRWLPIGTLTCCILLISLEPLHLPEKTSSITYREMLSALNVKPEDSSGDYDRPKQFGSWLDADGDCQNTRAEVLIRDSLVSPIFKGCRVISGMWTSIFDGRTYSSASDVQIDHLVPLKEAWESGASRWARSRRRSFANDLGYVGALSAMTTRLNGRCNTCKSDKDPAEWLPVWNPCLYVQRWVSVKYRWNLAVDKAEQNVLTKVLTGSCGNSQTSDPLTI